MYGFFKPCATFEVGEDKRVVIISHDLYELYKEKKGKMLTQSIVTKLLKDVQLDMSKSDEELSKDVSDVIERDIEKAEA